MVIFQSFHFRPNNLNPNFVRIRYLCYQLYISQKLFKSAKNCITDRAHIYKRYAVSHENKNKLTEFKPPMVVSILKKLSSFFEKLHCGLYLLLWINWLKGSNSKTDKKCVIFWIFWLTQRWEILFISTFEMCVPFYIEKLRFAYIM